MTTISVVIFLVALGVRFLTWQDNRRDVWRVQTYVTSDYKDSADQLVRGDFKSFVSDLNHLEHPPGYPILLAGIFNIFGESDTAIEFVQIVVDSLAAVVLFLLTLELLTATVATIAGVLAAISPQFSYHSVLLLPDSLVALPILLAVYFLVRAYKSHSLLNFVAAGVLVGISCWLRANALFLAPFLAIVALIILPRGKRLRAALAVVFGAIAVIAPITIKNAIVFHSFVPLSLGAGQTLLEGIAEYDETGRFGIPKTDLGIMRQEAEWYGKPEYAQWLFGSDGITRERMRIRRGAGIISSHPIWFGGVMLRRATTSIRLDPVPVLARDSPVSHSFEALDSGKRVWEREPTKMSDLHSGQSTLAVVNDQWLKVVGDETKYGDQIDSGEIAVEKYKDYVCRVPLKLEEGRAMLKVTGADASRVLSSMTIDLVEGVPAKDQPTRQLTLPFVSANNFRVHFILANNASTPTRPVVMLGKMELAELGDSAHQWLRYARIPIGSVQRFFTTAWMLPLVVIGIVLLLRARNFQVVAMLLIVPAYYLIVQSALHTERRYVYVIQFFFLVFASFTLWWIYAVVKNGITGLTRRPK